MDITSDITQALTSHNNGDSNTADALFPLVYAELRRLAHRQLRHNWADQTLCTTVLVHEAYLKLIHENANKGASREHFFAIAATAMRHILINYAEQKNAKKRGGDWQRIDFDEAVNQPEKDVKTLLLVDEALGQLSNIDGNLASLVEMKFFAGMTEQEISHVFNITERTVRRNWKKAKLLLMHLLEER